MSIQDPIANLFSSINNAQARNKEFVKVPSSSKKMALLSMLKQEGYIPVSYTHLTLPTKRIV